MKKFKFLPILLGVLFVASMISCTKEGVYNPKKKVQRVYYSVSSAWGSIDKYLGQTWNWDGNKIKSIDHYTSNGNTSYTENFTYDGNRIVRVDDYKNAEYTTYDYDGSHLKTINYYYRNKVERTMVFTYNSGKVSQIQITYYDAKKGDRHLTSSIIPFFPEKVNKAMSAFAEKADVKGVVTANYQFTWTDNNVTKIIASSEGEMTTMTFTYDAKKNPFLGFLCLEMGEDGIDSYYSKNNVTQYMESDINGENYILNYTYQYDGNDFPTMCIESELDDEDNYIYTTYYEYDK